MFAFGHFSNKSWAPAWLVLLNSIINVSLNCMRQYQASVCYWFGSIQWFICSGLVSLRTAKIRTNVLHWAINTCKRMWRHSSLTLLLQLPTVGRSEAVREKMDVMGTRQGLLWSVVGRIFATETKWRVRWVAVRLLASNTQTDQLWTNTGESLQPHKGEHVVLHALVQTAAGGNREARRLHSGQTLILGTSARRSSQAPNRRRRAGRWRWRTWRLQTEAFASVLSVSTMMRTRVAAEHQPSSSDAYRPLWFPAVGSKRTHTHTRTHTYVIKDFVCGDCEATPTPVSQPTDFREFLRKQRFVYPTDEYSEHVRMIVVCWLTFNIILVSGNEISHHSSIICHCFQEFFGVCFF